jgi:hypothetical protein
MRAAVGHEDATQGMVGMCLPRAAGSVQCEPVSVAPLAVPSGTTNSCARTGGASFSALVAATAWRRAKHAWWDDHMVASLSVFLKSGRGRLPPGTTVRQPFAMVSTLGSSPARDACE